jgi:pimeloyl-ACP methyl ester carboxylesterase
MKLEVISKQPSGKTHRTPLLFVHGAWHGAWSWENFLPYFAEQGYEVHAVSLRGHGNSEGKEGIRWYSAHDYVSDLKQVANSLNTHPVLIGHSMGGYVVQKYLESHNAPAGVLLTSAPTMGIIGFLLRWLRRHPTSTLKALVLLNTWYFVSTPALAKDAFFSDDFPNEQFREYYAHIQNESFRMALEMAVLRLPRPGRVRTPLLVLGGGSDRIFTVSEHRKTAQAYKTEAIIYPNMAHDMMLERGWENAADQILSWLKSRNL